MKDFHDRCVCGHKKGEHWHREDGVKECGFFEFGKCACLEFTTDVKRRHSEHIPRSQLVSMVADLRGILYEVKSYFIARELGRERISKKELQGEVTQALDRTVFDLSESDEVDGGFDPYHRELQAQQQYIEGLEGEDLERMKEPAKGDAMEKLDQQAVETAWKTYKTGTAHRCVGLGWEKAIDTGCGQILPRHEFRPPRPEDRLCKSCLRSWGAPAWKE